MYTGSGSLGWVRGAEETSPPKPNPESQTWLYGINIMIQSMLGLTMILILCGMMSNILYESSSVYSLSM